MRIVLFLLSGLLGGWPLLAQEPAADKLDAGLADAAQPQAVFVRMADQLFVDGQGYPAFCREHAGDDRRALRRQVHQLLREKSDRSWEALQPVVERLQASGEVQQLQRYWIVNGFACRASAQACRELAALPQVSFVYLQTLSNVPLHAAPRPAQTPSPGWRAAYEKLLREWDPDAEGPLNLEGVTLPWNVQRIKADQAWRETGATGQGVVVALCDTGMMLTPALTAALWKNPGEEFNGRDDDGNGLVDDVFGYDFGRDSWYALGDRESRPHGSMCAGIIAGRSTPSQRLQTGIAPRARMMVLRGMGYLKAYEYALAQGADVMSMSYMFMGRELGNYRGVYRLAHEHLAAGGVVAVGGAGNFSRAPAGQQIALPKDIPCVIAAAGILESGKPSPISSRGPCTWDGVKFYDDYPESQPLSKPDVTGCFGGYPVWGRLADAGESDRIRLVADEGNGMGLVVGPQGNSFSGPHAVGVAALMLSAHPGLPAWEVKRLMEATCQDLGEPGRDYETGAGLLDALAAVQAAQEAAKAPNSDAK